jgi:hypothetical protein
VCSTAGALRYAWNIRSRPSGSDASLLTTGEATTSFIADLAGIYLIELRVGTEQSESLPDVVRIIAEPGEGRPGIGIVRWKAPYRSV